MTRLSRVILLGMLFVASAAAPLRPALAASQDASTPSPSCSPDNVASALSAALPNTVKSVEDSQCGYAIHLLLPSPQEASLWFSYSPEGDLQTSLATLSCDSTCRNAARALEQVLIPVLEAQTPWASCPPLVCREATPPVRHDSVRGAAPTAPTSSPPFNTLVATIYLADAAAWVALALSLLFLLVRGLPGNSRTTGVALGLALLGFLLRACSSPRLPMSHTLLDFEQMADAISVLSGSFAFQQGISPLYLPSQGLFSAFLGWGLGLSVTGFFWVTTALGALSVAVAFRLGRQLTSSLAGGLFCGIAVASSPMNIMFSNGYNIETLAGLLVLLNISTFIDLMQRPGIAVAVAHAASLVLLANCRGESLALAGYLGALQCAVLACAGGRSCWATTKAFLATFGGLIAAALWLLPLVFGLLEAMQGQEASVAGRASGSFALAILAAALLASLTLFACKLPRSDYGAAFRTVSRHLFFASGIALASLLLAYFGLEALLPQPFEAPATPFAQLYAHRGDEPLGSLLGLLTEYLSRPALFPTLWLLPLLFSLAPALQLADRPLAAFAWLSTSWLAFLGLLVHQLPDGLLTLPGTRYMLTGLPLLATLAGLGTYRLVCPLLAGRLRSTAAAGAMLLLGLPAITHFPVYSDTQRNPQNEFLFAQKVSQHMADDTVIVIPDHGLSGTIGDPSGAVSVGHYRTWLMYKTLSFLQGYGEQGVSGLSELPYRSDLDGKRLLPAITGDCYRHTAPTPLAQACQEILDVPGNRVLEETSFPNRIMTEAAIGWGYGPHVPTLRLQLLAPPPAGQRTLLDTVHPRR